MLIDSELKQIRPLTSTNGRALKVVVLTQDEPFFLAESLDYLFSILPPQVEVVGCALFEASPFGKRENFTSKIYRTWKVFGTGFLMNYGSRFVVNKCIKKKKVSHVLNKRGIPIIELEESINAPSSLAEIWTYQPDLLVSIAGNQIFKKPLLELAPKGCLNLHTALLPKYRGLMPSFWVMKNNENETGVSVFMVDEGIDSGPILVQKRMPINGLSQKELIRKSKKVGMQAMAEAIHKVYHGDYDLLPNSDEESTYYSFPTKDDVREFKRRGKRFY